MASGGLNFSISKRGALYEDVLNLPRSLNDLTYVGPLKLWHGECTLTRLLVLLRALWSVVGHLAPAYFLNRRVLSNTSSNNVVRIKPHTRRVLPAIIQPLIDSSTIMFSNKKILIADPDPATRQLFSLILRKEGFTPIEACDAREAYRMIRSKTEFVGVVFDLLMPNIDTVQLLQFIRSDSRMAELPVLAIAADAGVTYIQECFTAGTTMFLPKPFTKGQLYSALLILLKSRMKKFDSRRVFAA